MTSLPMDAPPTHLTMKVQSRLRFLDSYNFEPIDSRSLSPVDLSKAIPAGDLSWFESSDNENTEARFDYDDEGIVVLSRGQGDAATHLSTNVKLRGATEIYAQMDPQHLAGIRFQHPQTGVFYSLYALQQGEEFGISMIS